MSHRSAGLAAGPVAEVEIGLVGPGEDAVIGQLGRQPDPEAMLNETFIHCKDKMQKI
jgi:hypothetical protein